MTNLEWIASGATGCTFATLFAKDPACVGWESRTPIEWIINFQGFRDTALIISIVFPDTFTKEMVKEWSIERGFFVESTGEETEGLRIQCKEGISWVQYFGPDSHVVTRRAPYPMLMYTQKLGTAHYVKVGWKGILHLAHAYASKISERVYDLLWSRSYKQTCKKLGHTPTIKEAAKTTWLK